MVSAAIVKMRWIIPLLLAGLIEAVYGQVCDLNAPAAWQNNTDRAGPAYQSFTVDGASTCRDACCANDPCSTWAARIATPDDKPATPNCTTGAMCCWLKSGYNAPAVRQGCTSGVVYRPAWQQSELGKTIAGLRGFNYVPQAAVNDIDMWTKYDKAVVERDMAYAGRVGFNFARVFLNYVVWKAEGEDFIAKVAHFISTAHANGIRTMPILFDMCWFGCRNETHFSAANATGKCWYASPGYSRSDDQTWWTTEGEAYAGALARAFSAATTPGLIIWDITNEPESYGGSHGDLVWPFVRHFIKYMQSVSDVPTTVGVASWFSMPQIGADVDVLSFHSPSRFVQNTFFRTNALHCTATARILIPAECSAIL